MSNDQLQEDFTFDWDVILGSLMTLCIALSLRNCTKLHWLILSPTTVTCNSLVLQKVRHDWLAVFMKTVAMMNSAQCWHTLLTSRLMQEALVPEWLSLSFPVLSCVFSSCQGFFPFREPSEERFSARSCNDPTKFPSSTSWDFNWSPAALALQERMEQYSKAETKWNWKSESCSALEALMRW